MMNEIERTVQPASGRTSVNIEATLDLAPLPPRVDELIEHAWSDVKRSCRSLYKSRMEDRANAG